MSTVDLIILLLFIPGLIQGIRKGFVSQAIALVSVFAGIWLAFHFAEMLCAWMMQFVPKAPHTLLYVISFILVVCAVIILMGAVAKALRKLIDIVMMGLIDRLLGLVFATLTSLLIISILVVMFSYVNNITGLVSADTLEESSLYGPIKDFAYKVFPYLKGFIVKS